MQDLSIPQILIIASVLCAWDKTEHCPHEAYVLTEEYRQKTKTMNIVDK